MLLGSFVLCMIMLTISTATDTILVNESIRDGKSIVSKGKNFELGFFSPGSSKNRYVGIWYKKSPGTVVWVANRETPLSDTLGEFRFTSYQRLVLLNVTKGVVWSSNTSGSVSDPVVQLLSDGDLVIKDKNEADKENWVWRSFDYPGDTYLPGMKIGKNFVTGRETRITSWKSADDPSPGEYSLQLFMKNYVQTYKKKGPVIECRLGPWMGEYLAGWVKYKQNPVFSYKHHVVVNKKEMYYKMEYNSTVLLERGVMTREGGFELSHLVLDTPVLADWRPDFTIPLDICDRYGLCGANGMCNTSSFLRCDCLDGFEPKHAKEVNKGNWSRGCQLKVPLTCESEVGFCKFSNLKLPDTMDSWFNQSMSLGECETACKNKCSCTAYANPFTTGENGCLLWFGDLIDVREYQQNGQDLYIRVHVSQLLENEAGSSRKKRTMIEASFSVSAVVVLLVLILIFYIWGRKTLLIYLEVYVKGDQKEDFELPFFSFSKVVRATNNFSIDNKLGEGGFGPVYKGVLESGEEVAMKRLSETSRQGSDEFINEATCIAKLQHRNLVKLLGYCIQGDERILIYEYMPNKSLDWFIFGNVKESLLDWGQRFNVINGIARGLLYLHQDSRLRIIHRDLKAGNILLDLDLNPKISDFGLARMFSEQEETKTNKIVGTLGYISPEYALNGHFSVKSDIFSFGVLVLEIVSGNKNRGFSHKNHHISLLGHAWELHKKGQSLELADASLDESWVVSEVLQSIHVGLLCVQQNADDRPNMSSVIHMLDTHVSLPPPNQPGFFTATAQASGMILPQQISVNEVTITQLDYR